MTTLYEELTGNAYRLPRTSRGQRVSFLQPGEEVEEIRLERESPKINPYGTRRMVKGIPKKELVLAALRDGRARFVFDIINVTELAYDTVVATLRDLRIAGEVEFHHVGNCKLWSRTTKGAE